MKRPEQIPYGVKDFKRIRQLSGGTPVHFIDLEFVGREMRVCEEVTFC